MHSNPHGMLGEKFFQVKVRRTNWYLVNELNFRAKQFSLIETPFTQKAEKLSKLQIANEAKLKVNI